MALAFEQPAPAALSLLVERSAGDQFEGGDEVALSLRAATGLAADAESLEQVEVDK